MVKEQEEEEEDDFNFIRSQKHETQPKKKAEPSKLIGLGAAADFAK